MYLTGTPKQTTKCGVASSQHDMRELVLSQRESGPVKCEPKAESNGNQAPSMVEFNLHRDCHQLERIFIYIFRVLAALSVFVHVGIPFYVRAIVIGISMLRTGRTESFFVMKSLGVQLRSEGPFVFSKRVRFVPTSEIVDIVINEVFVGLTIQYVMVVIIQGENRLEVVFDKLRPRLAILKSVWQQSRRCLFEKI